MFSKTHHKGDSLNRTFGSLLFIQKKFTGYPVDCTVHLQSCWHILHINDRDAAGI